MAADTYIYFCRNCGKILFGPDDLEDEDLECPNCGEKANPTGLEQKKWESMSTKSRDWQISLWKNQTDYDDSIVENYADYETEEDEDSYYSPEYKEPGDEEEDILSPYTSEVRDWQTNPPDEDGEYIVWFIRRDKEPSSRKLKLLGGFWLDAKGEEVDIEKYHPALWMQLPTFSEELIEMFRNR